MSNLHTSGSRLVSYVSAVSPQPKLARAPVTRHPAVVCRAMSSASPDVAEARDRAAGAIMGLLIGDALSLGCHWYYDLNTLRKEFGPWIDSYTEPRPGRYHASCTAGNASQTGQVAGLLLRSLAERHGYNEADFCSRLDGLLDTLDGTAEGGRYTDVAMRELWRGRKGEGLPWPDATRHCWSNTSEGAQRAVVLAARYASNLRQAAELSLANIQLTHIDPAVTGQSMCFAIVLAALVTGARLDEQLTFGPGGLWEQAKRGELPVAHAALADEDNSAHTPVEPTKLMPRPDHLFQAGWVAAAARDSGSRIPDATRVGMLFGMGCNIDFLIPAAYYLAAYFEDLPAQEHWEQAVLTAVNSGGNNMARAALTGALVGAMRGASAIPQRFIDGLTDGSELMALARQLAADAFPDQADLKGH